MKNQFRELAVSIGGFSGFPVGESPAENDAVRCACGSGCTVCTGTGTCGKGIGDAALEQLRELVEAR